MRLQAAGWPNPDGRKSLTPSWCKKWQGCERCSNQPVARSAVQRSLGRGARGLEKWLRKPRRTKGPRPSDPRHHPTPLPNPTCSYRDVAATQKNLKRITYTSHQHRNTGLQCEGWVRGDLGITKRAGRGKGACVCAPDLAPNSAPEQQMVPRPGRNSSRDTPNIFPLFLQMTTDPSCPLLAGRKARAYYLDTGN